MIHHVQLACPAGVDRASRSFYAGVLGLEEISKPPALRVRGGCWFRGYGLELHLGVEAGFRPATKAHPGLMWPDLDVLAARLVAAGHSVEWSDELLALDPPLRRFYTADPHGNRLEFLAPARRQSP